MALNTQSFTTIVRQQVAAIQASCTTVLSFFVGSLELARVEAVAGVSMWLQALVMRLLTMIRLATCSGADVDSFVGDFGLTRLAAVAATNQVTFSRFTATQSATIPAGTLIQTSDGTQQFFAIPDTTQSFWNAALSAYVIPANTASGSVTVQAVNAGIQGNVNANTITTISTAIVGVDTVTNASAFTNGVDVESDTALKARFVTFIQGLREGIKAAVASAIAGLQQGIQYTLTENQAYGGATQLGFFYVVINPSSSPLQAAVYAAIDLIRPLGSTFGVFPASQLTANVAVTVTATAGYTHGQIATSIQAALQAFIATIPLGQSLLWSQLYSVVWSVPGVATATSLTLNSSTSDLTATSQQVIVAGTLTVN